MRSIPTFLVLLVASFLLFCCHESKPVPKYPIEGAVDVSQPAPTTAAAGVNPNVKHYTCPNNCANSGGDGEGTCPTCGTAYVHNAAYHNNPATAPTPGAQPVTTETSTSQISLSDPTNAAQEPAQNAAGVWHYTCSAGCAGGGGAAGNCASCGSALAHNAAYHN